MADRQPDYGPIPASIARALNDRLYEKRKGAALEIEKLVRDLAQKDNIKDVQKIIEVLDKEFVSSANQNAKRGGVIGLAATAIGLGKDTPVPLPLLLNPVLRCFNDTDSRTRYSACEALYNIIKMTRSKILVYLKEIINILGKLLVDSDLNVRNGVEPLDKLMKFMSLLDLIRKEVDMKDRTLAADKILKALVYEQLGYQQAASKIRAGHGIRVKQFGTLANFISAMLCKDIVAETPKFDVDSFVAFLRDNIFVTNSTSRQFLLSWITTLDSLKDVDLITFLPELLDGLFTVLGDPQSDVKKMVELAILEDSTTFIKQCGHDRQLPFMRSLLQILARKFFALVSLNHDKCAFCLENFLQQIKKDPSKVEFSLMISILIKHSQSQDPDIQLTALKWIGEFLKLDGRHLLPFASGILGQVLPCVSYKDARKNDIREVAKSVNRLLMGLITMEDDRSQGNGEVETGETKEKESGITPEALPISGMVAVLIDYIHRREMETKIAVLHWIKHLLQTIPKMIFQHMDSIFPELMKTLSDETDEVVLFNLEVLTMIVQSEAGPTEAETILQLSKSKSKTGSEGLVPGHGMNMYFTLFMNSLMETFSSKPELLKTKGSFIIRQLCLFLNAEHIYRSLSEILLESHELKFSTEMVRLLNQILVTSSELFELRNQLKDLADRRSCLLFCCLYKTWCHSPVATVSLCLLSQCHQHASHLIYKFGDLEVTIDFLMEVDKLVQLIESPIFTYLRLQLLEGDQNPYLVKSLYGILMLLPQSKTFDVLHKRLACVPNVPAVSTKDGKKSPQPDRRPHVKDINWAELSDHFDIIQLKHVKMKKMRHRALEERKRHLGLNT